MNGKVMDEQTAGWTDRWIHKCTIRRNQKVNKGLLMD